jgi:hypothetical protein
MPFRPNFTDAKIDGEDVRVEGVSDEDSTDDILDIRVTLAQGDERIERGSVGKVTSVWNVRVPVKDPSGQAADFGPGPVVAFGVETRRKDSTTTTWAQTLRIT